MTRTIVRPGSLYAWYGPSLLLVTAEGHCAAADQLTGYYHREARFLRTWQLQVDDEAPWLCEAAAIAPDRLQFAYVYPEVAEYGGGGSGQSGDDEPRNRHGIPQRAIDIRVEYQVRLNELIVAATIANRALDPLAFDVGLDVRRRLCRHSGSPGWPPAADSTNPR